jgi:putative membrane protein insertion efficiency factor
MTTHQSTSALLHRVLVALVLVPVRLYRLVLSPLKRTPTCRFLPTCSEYAVEVVEQRGVVVGVALAVRRISRCHPLCDGGYDPVPPRVHAGLREHEEPG